MANFTQVSSWSKGGQDKTGAEEIVTAYKEHREVLKQSIAGIELPTNAQSKALWVGIQTWLETYCTEFIDHVNGPLNTAKDDLLYFTLDSWQKAAGLNESATASETWRRKSDPTAGFSYGRIQNGDLRQGAWVFEDLQKGLGVLTTTRVHVLDSGLSEPLYDEERYRWEQKVDKFTQDAQLVIDDWEDDMDLWGGITSNQYMVERYANLTFQGDRIIAHRKNWTPIVCLNTDYDELPEIERVVKHYGRGVAFMSQPGTATFVDIDNVGLVEGEYVVLDTSIKSSTEFVKMQKLTDDAWCPILPAYHPRTNPVQEGVAVTSRFLAEWDFSYE